jgi:2-phosphosulfolactate phosphatase
MRHPLRWHCHALPAHLPPGAPGGGIAVVIDVLRATTTMATALAHGAVRIVPLVDVAAARDSARAVAGAVLGGERGGVRIEGFDLGNSPLEYSRERVAGRTIVMTTTNGTAAIAACRAAVEILAGAVVNRAAVAATARARAATLGVADVHLVCAGTDGRETGEDLLAAGAILDAAATAPGAADDALDAAALAARERFRRLAAAHPADLPAALATAFATTPGGAALVGLGMEEDLAACARVDLLSTVPRLDPATGSLVPAAAAAGAGQTHRP